MWIYVSSVLAASARAASHDITLSGAPGSWRRAAQIVCNKLKLFRLATLETSCLSQFDDSIMYPENYAWRFSRKYH